MSLQIDITENGGSWPDRISIDAVIEKAVRHTSEKLQLESANSEISIVLTDDAEIRRLNADWRKKDKPTNVLSFPVTQMIAGQRPGPMLGDIILAYETIQREAEDLAIGFLDHTAHLVVHGMLHLLGYDHEQDGDAEKMEALEIEILERMGIKDPYSVPISDS